MLIIKLTLSRLAAWPSGPADIPSFGFYDKGRGQLLSFFAASMG